MMHVKLDSVLFFRGVAYGPGVVAVPEELARRRNLKPLPDHQVGDLMGDDDKEWEGEEE